jgi:hypothetical protein
MQAAKLLLTAREGHRDHYLAVLKELGYSEDTGKEYLAVARGKKTFADIRAEKAKRRAKFRAKPKAPGVTKPKVTPPSEPQEAPSVQPEQSPVAGNDDDPAASAAEGNVTPFPARPLLPMDSAEHRGQCEYAIKTRFKEMTPQDRSAVIKFAQDLNVKLHNRAGAA